MRCLTLSLACRLVLITTLAQATEPFFLPLGFPSGRQGQTAAVGVSADGSVVVGRYRGMMVSGCTFRWTAESGFALLGSSPSLPWSGYSCFAQAVSADGRAVVGYTRNGQPFRWTEQDGLQVLPPLPAANASFVYGVSHDGSVAVGRSGDWAVRWDGLTPTALGTGRATGISKDASHIIVFSPILPAQGYILTNSSVTSLGPVRPEYISADGSTVIGTRMLHAWRWTAQEGIIDLWPMAYPYGGSRFRAMGISGDGSLIVGSWGHDEYGHTVWEFTESVVPEETVWVPEWPFIWDAEHGCRDLREALVNECGLDLGDFQILSADAISADGYTVAGAGKNGLGSGQAWVAHLLEPVLLPLDIRPGECPNTLNRTSNGVLTVAVLGSRDFDVSKIDPATMVLTRKGVSARITPEKCSIQDVAASPLGGAGCTSSGPDGIPDLVLKFRTRAVVDGLQLSAFSPGETLVLTVKGRLIPLDGKPARPLLASDSTVLTR